MYLHTGLAPPTRSRRDLVCQDEAGVLFEAGGLEIPGRAIAAVAPANGLVALLSVSREVYRRAMAMQVRLTVQRACSSNPQGSNHTLIPPYHAICDDGRTAGRWRCGWRRAESLCAWGGVPTCPPHPTLHTASAYLHARPPNPPPTPPPPPTHCHTHMRAAPV